MMKMYTDEYGFVNFKISNGYSVLVGIMTKKSFDTYLPKYGYEPQRYRISSDNGRGLACGVKTYETKEELAEVVENSNMMTEEEKQYLLFNILFKEW